MNTRNLPESAGATAPDGTPARGGRPNQVGLRVYRQPLVTNVSAARWLLLAIVAASIYFFHGFLVPVLAAAVIALASWPSAAKASGGHPATWVRCISPSVWNSSGWVHRSLESGLT